MIDRLKLSWLISAGLAGALIGCAAPPSGADGQLITRSTALAPGDACPAGGTAIEIGHDRNGNGVLDPGEVETTRDVCDTPGPATLVRNDPEPPGAHCAAGGRAIRTGPDTNGNGVLDDDEVATTTYVCDAADLFDGDFTAAMWSDPDAVARLADAKVVTGTLTIDGPHTIALPKLELVAGAIVVPDATAGTTFDLPSLRQVSGDLLVGPFGLAPAVTPNGLEAAIELPALQLVSGNVRIEEPAAATISAPALTTVVGSVAILDMQDIELPALTSAGSISLAYDPGLTTVPLPSLTTVDGELSFDGDAALSSLAGMPALRTVGDVVIYQDDAITSADLTQLTHLDGISVIDSYALASLRLPTEQRMKDGVYLNGEPALGSLTIPVYDLGNVDVVGGHLTRLVLDGTSIVGGSYEGRPTNAGASLSIEAALDELDAPALMEAGRGIHIRSNTITSLALPQLIDAEQLYVKSTSLASLDAPNLREIDRVSIDAPLTTLSLGIQDVGALTVRNTQLTSLSGLDKLVDVYGALTLTGDTALATLGSLAGLVQVGGTVTITGDPALSPDEIAAFVARVKAPPASP